MAKEIEGVDYVRRNRTERKVGDRVTESLDEFARWIWDAYFDGYFHFASFKQVKVTAGCSLVSTAGNRDETYDFEVGFNEAVTNQRCRSMLKYQFGHNDKEDEPLEDYVNGQLRSIGEKVGPRLREGHVKIEKNVLYAIKNQ